MAETCSHSCRNLIAWSLFIFFLSLVSLPLYKLLVNFQVPYQTGFDKCPKCLGTEMCDCFINHDFSLNWDHFWANLLNIILKNKILFGYCGKQAIVLKWIESDSKVFSTKENLNFDNILQNIKSLPITKQPNTSDKLFICPSSEKLDALLKPIITSTDKTPIIRSLDWYQNLFYGMQITMEHLIQLITSEWAVARFLGACGDISVSEYCGYSLTSVFSDLSWDKRSSVAKQLLIFALNVTFDNPEFGFYFTDLSADNFAVSDSGEVRLVDLDNVIIVDKNPSDLPDGWDVAHTSYHDGNISGFTFSTEEICSHRISDTNVYSICQGILSEDSDLLPGGLLHSAPSHLTGLKNLIELCTSPSVGQSRLLLAVIT